MQNASETRPDVPKKLAARLRAVYAKLSEARSAIANGEAEIAYRREYLAYFESDPEKFAERHYPKHAVDSYPVTTHIGRHRESLAHREERVPQRYAELPAVEEAVFTAEAEVLEQLAKMRADTPGRVPWPKRPAPLDYLRRESMKYRMRELQKYLKYVAVHSEKRKQEEAARKAKLKASMEETERLWSITLAAMPPAKAAVYGAFWNAMRDGLNSGALQAHGIGSIGAGLDSVIQEALTVTRQKLSLDSAPSPSSEGRGQADSGNPLD